MSSSKTPLLSQRMHTTTTKLESLEEIAAFALNFNQFPCFYYSYVYVHLVCILALYLLMLLILIFFYNSWQSCHSARRVFRTLHLVIVPGSQNTFLVPTQQGLHVASTACRPLNGLIAKNKKKHFQDLATATVHSYCIC